MSWPIPAPGAIADAFSAGFGDAFALDDDGTPFPTPPDTTSPDSAFRVIGVVGEKSWTELYLYQRSLADELMPDTAQDWLPRHAAEWGVPRLLPLTAVGSLVIADAPGTVLPSGIEVQLAGVRYVTRASATIGSSGAVSVPAESEVAGAGQDLAAGAVLAFVSPVTGVTTLAAVVDAGGMLGSRALEDLEPWRARILRRIRQRGRAGNGPDYEDWATAAGAAYVNVVPRVGGPGTVGVVVAMPGPRAPNGGELARIQAGIDAERPVTAEAVAIAAVLLPVPVILAVSPDTVGTRAAVTLGVQAFFLRDGGIGRPIARSRLDEAISSASGEYAHRVDSPVGDLLPSYQQLPVADAVTFVASSALPSPPAGA